LKLSLCNKLIAQKCNANGKANGKANGEAISKANRPLENSLNLLDEQTCRQFYTFSVRHY
jgi:hypothetical protein